MINNPVLTEIINSSFEQNGFSNELKLADIIPIFKKKDPLNKESYRPVSILSHMSKVFERIIYKQIANFIKNKISVKLCGFRKNHNTQYSLISMLEKWKASLDKGEYVGVTFIDLWNAFHTINHDLLLTKLKENGFSHNTLAFMLSYLKNRSHRVTINNNFSKCEEIIAGVPKGSILGPLLFNIFINDIFCFEDKSYLSNYADDNVLYAFGSNMTKVKDKLSQDLPKLSEWFTKNFMILNPDKCYHMCLGKDTVNDILKFCDKELKSSKLETVLKIEIDQKLTFSCHVKTLSSKAAK